MNIAQRMKEKNLAWKVKLLTPYFSQRETVLDFGAGDLTFAHRLKKENPQLSISGVDVVNFKEKPTDIPFYQYDGKMLPFKDRTFDTVIAFYVFHHCDDALFAFNECFRVAKKRVIFVESLPRTKFEVYPMRLMDWFYNIWKPEKIELPYQFYPLDTWKKIFRKQKVSLNSLKEISDTPLSFLPIGRSYIFEVTKRS